MGRLPIFTESSDGNLTPMLPGAPPDEDSLQDLIARFPEIISSDGEPMLLVRREQSVPDSLDGSGRWSIDHLFVTRGAEPVLVEVKRASDTRIRREVVGQLMDYAANGVAYWKPGTLAEAFEIQQTADGSDPAIVLSDFLGEKDPDDFWDQVDANLTAGRVRLIIAADQIPKELARIVEFLNEQMRCSVLAVELTYFVADDGRRTLAPKVIGETERAESAKTAMRGKRDPVSVEDWISKHFAEHDSSRSAATRFLQFAEAQGARTDVTVSQASVSTTWQTHDESTVRPFFLKRNGTISTSFYSIMARPGLSDEKLRQDLINELANAVGGLSTMALNGEPSFPAERLNDPTVLAQFEAIARKIIGLGVDGP